MSAPATPNPAARPSTVPKGYRAPAGCFCGIIHSSLACLTCTCPDCGAHGRYGAPITHAPLGGRTCEGEHSSPQQATHSVQVRDSDSAANYVEACGTCAAEAALDPELIVEAL